MERQPSLINNLGTIIYIRDVGNVVLPFLSVGQETINLDHVVFGGGPKMPPKLARLL